jgi:hypothetical protein
MASALSLVASVITYRWSRVSKISRFEKYRETGIFFRGNREKPGKTGKFSFG